MKTANHDSSLPHWIDIRRMSDDTLDGVLESIVHDWQRRRKLGESDTAIFTNGLWWRERLRNSKRCNSSLSFAKLLRYIADLQIANAASREQILFARRLIQESAEIVEIKLSTGCEAAATAWIKCQFYFSAVDKMLLRRSEALDRLEDSEAYAQKCIGLNRFNTIDLSRQRALITQSESDMASLLEWADFYEENDALEAFGAVKRVFEFLLNNSEVSTAKTLKPVLQRLYRAAESEISNISKISFAKNMLQYRIVTDEADTVIADLQRLKAISQSLRYFGQSKQISALIRSVGGEISDVTEVFEFEK